MFFPAENPEKTGEMWRIEMQSPNDYLIFNTDAGHCAIAWHGAGITRFQLPVATHAEAEKLMLRKVPLAHAAKPDAGLRTTIEQVKAYFAGVRTEFTHAALDIGVQSPFFSKVYDAVRRLHWGQSTTYGAVAKELGAGPEAARDVGQAMAKNPVPLFIPCHRVLAAGGRLGGFSAPGGVAAKKRMLELEGIFKNTVVPAQASLF